MAAAPSLAGRQGVGGAGTISQYKFRSASSLWRRKCQGRNNFALLCSFTTLIVIAFFSFFAFFFFSRLATEIRGVSVTGSASVQRRLMFPLCSFTACKNN